ncbi:GHKL domain-containing protein [Vagococcus silagei]
MIKIEIPFFIVYTVSFIDQQFNIGLINDSNTFFYFTFSELLSYSLIILISLFFLKVLLPWLTSKKILNILTISTVPLFCIYQIQQFLLYSDSLQLIVVLSISMLLMLLFLIIIFNNIKNYQNLKQENEKKKIEIEYLIKYTDETQKNYQELRRFKHDYLNILLSLEYFIQQKDFSKLEEYYYSKIKKTGQQLTTESNEIKILENIESEEVKSIFMMKLLVARQKNITFSIEIPEKIANSTSVNIVILIRILGIILDNAIEAVENDKNGKIEIGIFLMTNATLFVIKNTLKEHIPPLHQLKQEGFSTKGPNRGLGLTNIDNLSQKEEYLTINTKISDSWFTQELFIQNEGY